MNINEQTPREAGFGVGGVDDLSIYTPFSEGHVCNEREAGALNQLLKENTRNNIREKVKEAVANGAAKEDVQKLLDEYVAGYEFGATGGGGGRSSDPVMAEALDSARKLIRKALIQSGVKLSTVTTADINAKAKKLIERRPDMLKAARKAVQDRDKNLSSVLDDVNEG